MATSVNVGEKEVKRADFGSKLEQWKAMHESAGASRRSNVTTSPRRDVPMSRCWVNHYQSQQAVTSRRLNVATSQCRDVATSRRQREICPPSLKAPRVQNWRHRETYELGHRNPEQQRHILPRRARDLYCFPFLDNRMMFLRLNIYIFLFIMF